MDEGPVGYSVSTSATPQPPVTPLPVTPPERSEEEDELQAFQRDQMIEAFRAELRLLRNRLAKKDQELSDCHVEAVRHKNIKRDSAKIANELQKKTVLLQEEQDHSKEVKAQMEQYRAQWAEYKQQVEQLKRAAESDAKELSKALKEAKEAKEAKARESEAKALLEAEVQQNRATIEDLRAKLEALGDGQDPIEPDAKETKETKTLSSPKSKTAVPPARPAKNLRMALSSGNIDLDPENVARFTEAPSSESPGPQAAKSREEEMPQIAHDQDIFSTHLTNSSQGRVDQVHLSGIGTADSASTLAKVLLSRLNLSVYYGPEQQRRAQHVQYMYTQQMQLFAQNGVQVQTNHAPVQSVGLPTGQMQMHGISMPTQG